MLCEGSTNKYVAVCGVVSVSIYGSSSEGNGSVQENQMVVNYEYWVLIHSCGSLFSVE